MYGTPSDVQTLHNDIIASSRTDRSAMPYHPSRLVTYFANSTYIIPFLDCSAISVYCGTKEFKNFGMAAKVPILLVSSFPVAVFTWPYIKAPMLPQPRRSLPATLSSRPSCSARHCIYIATTPVIAQIRRLTFTHILLVTALLRPSLSPIVTLSSPALCLPPRLHPI